MGWQRIYCSPVVTQAIKPLIKEAELVLCNVLASEQFRGAPLLSEEEGT